MVSYTELVEFNPDTMREAAGQWRTVADGLADQREALGSRVRDRLAAPTWTGVAADAAYAHITALSAVTDRQSTRSCGSVSC